MSQHIQVQFAKYRKSQSYQYYEFVEGNERSPRKLSIQKTVKVDRILAPYVLYNGDSRKFISGLKPVQPGWYYGDVLRENRRKYLLIHVDGPEVSVYVFPIYPKEREVFTRQVIYQIIHEKKGPDKCQTPITHSTTRKGRL
jgi:hypothetical protein